MKEDADDIVHRIRKELNVSEVIGDSLALLKQGKNFLAVCPWHTDDRPSLQVDVNRSRWKCWVCNTGGDVIAFVMAYRQVSYEEAVIHLAARLPPS